MSDALLVLLPVAGFGLFALLALRFGAETRPGFDEKPVHDDRPNWPAIARSGPSTPPLGRPEPRGGAPVAVAQGAAPAAGGASGRRTPSPAVRPASA